MLCILPSCCLSLSLSARHHLPPAALSRHPQGCLAFHVILNNEFISLNERAERQAPPTSLLPSQTFLRGSQSEPRIPSTSPLRTLPLPPPLPSQICDYIVGALHQQMHSDAAAAAATCSSGAEAATFLPWMDNENTRWVNSLCSWESEQAGARLKIGHPPSCWSSFIDQLLGFFF